LAEPVHSLAESALATVREVLGAELFGEAFTVGQQISLDEAFATILTPDGFTNTTIRSRK